jgi:hypothetical protein
MLSADAFVGVKTALSASKIPLLQTFEAALSITFLVPCPEKSSLS